MMNKFGMVLGATVVATLAGCKDPDYVSKYAQTSQNDVKNAATEVAPAKPVEVQPIESKPVATTEVKPIESVPAEPIVAPAPTPVAKPVEPAYTVYTVRSGDYLAKISKKYNVTISSIKRLNPKMKGDTVCVGQKIKLPGVIDVEAAPVAAPKAAPAAKASKKGASDYTGATVEYVVKNGDTLGGVAYGHGINIRQLKKLNNLSSDSLRIGQKLKVPANGKVAAKASKTAKAVAPAKAASAPAEAAPTADAAPVPTADATPAPAAEASSASAPAADAASAPAADAAPAEAAAPAPAPALKTYVVQEGEDMAAVSVAWGVTASQIRELNNLGENDQLKPGQTIRLPAEADQK